MNTRNYTTADVDRSGRFARLTVDRKDIISNPPAWMARGLSQTASGYGRRLLTSGSIRFNGRVRRIYCCCFSNSGTCYIRGGGNWSDGGNLLIDSY